MYKHINLVLVQPLPANEEMCSGVIKFLQDYFTVHFVELPGFSPDRPAEGRVSLEYFTNYVEQYIADHDLDNFILGGISFGFMIAVMANVDENKCIAKCGLMPFMGGSSLSYSRRRMLMYKFLTRAVALGRNRIRKYWGGDKMRGLIKKHFEKNDEYIDFLFDEVDPDVFLDTIRLSLASNSHKLIKPANFLLFVNEKDHVVKTDYVIGRIKGSIAGTNKKLKIIHTDLQHYPERVTYEYFKDHVTPQVMKEAMGFLAELEAV